MQRFQHAVGPCIAQVQVRNRPGASPQLAGLCSSRRGTFQRHKSSLNSGTSPVVSYGLQLSCCQAVVPEPGQTNAGLFFSKDEKSPPQRRTNFNDYSMLPVATHHFCDGDRLHHGS